MILFLATKNKYKIKQFSHILKNFNFEIKTISDFDFNEIVEENAETARENALIKARFWAKKTKLLTLADDAGLEIDMLNGEPGIKARRWGGIFEDNISDEDWLNYLMERMEGIPFEKRTARYRAAWALILPNGKEYVKDILLEFLISEKPKLPHPVGSPMSSVRFFPDYKKIETELTEEEQWSKLSKEIKDWDILKLLGK